MEVCGRFSCSDCQWPPSSNDTHTLVSLPANSSPFRTGSSRTVSIDASEGVPNDASIDTVREDPVRKGLLFAGSETSVWVSFDDGGHWQSLQLNLPHTSMRDLWIHSSDLIVATHGRSFWILDDITPLRQIDEKAMQSSAWLCRPAPAYRVRRDTN